MADQGNPTAETGPAIRSRVSPARKRQFIALIALIFVGGQELLLRWLFPIPEVENFNRINYSVLLPREGEQPAPLRNARYRFSSEPDGFSYVHELNLYGFRDRQWSLVTRPGWQRVIFVGDSFTEGAGAPEGATIADGFRDAAGDKPVEVMNLGIQGTGLGHYLVLLGDAVPLFRPDHVVVVLMANDFGNMAPVDARRLLGLMGRGVVNSPGRPRLFYLLEKVFAGQTLATAWKSQPFAFFASVPDPRNPWSDERERGRMEPWVGRELAESMKAGRLNPHLPLGHEAQQYWFPRPSPIQHHLAVLRDFMRHHECRLSVVFFPAQGQVSDAYIPFHAEYNVPPVTSLMGAEYQRPARDTAEACRALGISFVDLTPYLRAREATGHRCYWNYDNHPKGETYLNVGRLLYEQLGTPSDIAP